MILFAVTLLGLLAAGAALALTRAAAGAPYTCLPDPFGLAVAQFAGWIALAALALAGLIAFGIPAGIGGAGLALALAFVFPAGAVPLPVFRLTLPLAIVAVLLAVLALVGVLNLIEGATLNG